MVQKNYSSLMIFRIFLPVWILSLVVACGRNRPQAVESSGVDTTGTRQPELKAGRQESPHDPGSLIKKDSIFPAYKITERSLGLVLEFSEEGTRHADRLFEALVPDPWHNPVVDSGMLFILRKDKHLNDLLAAESTELYVTGMKGSQPVSPADVVYHLDEEGCRSGFILIRFGDYNISKNGFPLLCTTSPLKLDRCYCEDLNDLVNTYEKEQAYDYADSLNSRVYARKDSLVFAYSDDFAWERGQCYFPARKIFVQKQNNSVAPVWSASLDLFGIPCD